MIKFLIFLALGLLVAVTVCKSAPPVPTSTTPPVTCGYIPDNIFKCIGNPKIMNEASHDCQASKNQCEKMKCIFQKSGWLDGEKVKRPAVLAHFEQFAVNHPDWAAAVDQVKSTCLATDLPPQSVFLNCPAYDIMMCSFGVFIANAQPTQWSASQECSYPRQYAAACPVCPGDCFAPAIPIGSCNSCSRLPRRNL